MKSRKVIILYISCMLTGLSPCAANTWSPRFSLNPGDVGQRLVGHVILTQEGVTLARCVKDCWVATECLSFNHRKSTGLCELNSANRTTAGDAAFQSDELFMHSDITVWPKEMAGSCTGKPCRPGHMCIPLQNSYTCMFVGPVSTCLKVKQCSPSYGDGEYWIQSELLSKKIRLYCHNMATENPQEYLTLPPGKNDAYNCGSVENTGIHARKLINFEKVAIDLKDLTIVADDFTFSDDDGSNNGVKFGVAAGCLRGVDGHFNIDTSGTGFILDPSLVWQAVGHEQYMRVFSRSADNTHITASCGGWCGKCRSTSAMTLHLNPTEDIPLTSATMPSCG